MARTPRIEIAMFAGGLAVVLNLLFAATAILSAAPPQTPPLASPQPLILTNPYYARSEEKTAKEQVPRAETTPESMAVPDSADPQAPDRYATTFASTKSNAAAAAEPSDWSPPTVKNPFSPDAKMPIRQEPLRWGPVSRWRSPERNESETTESETAVATDFQSLTPLAGMPYLEPTGTEEADALSAAFGVNQLDESMNSTAGEGHPPDAASWVTNEIQQPTWLQTAEQHSAAIALDTNRWHSPEEGPFDPFEAPQAEPDTEAIFVSDDSVISDDTAVASDNTNRAEAEPEIRPEFQPEFRPIAQPNRAVVQASAYTRYPAPPALPAELVRANTLHPNTLQRAQQQAQSAKSLGDYAAVIRSCDTFLASMPAGDDKVKARELSAWAHNRSGELLADGSQPKRAMREFEIALQHDPTNSLALHNRAIQLAQQGDYEEALRDFSAAIDQNPSLKIAYSNRAELLSALGQSQAAIDDYTAALRYQPDDEQLLVLRAHSLHRIRDYSKAMADFNAALRLVPTNPDAYSGRGNLHAEMGNYRSAIEDFRQALLADASWGEAYRSLAWLLATCPDPQYQNPRRAMLAAREAAKLGSKDDPFVLEALAAASASVGQFRAAAELQKRALAIAPEQMASRMEHRLALYQQDRPYRSGMPTGVRQASYEE